MAIKIKRTHISVLLFAAGFLLAGLLHLLDRWLNQVLVANTTADGSAALAFFSSLLFVLNLTIYCVMLLWWMQSVYTRLLPSAGRSCMLAAAVLMVVFLLIRSVKYRLAAYDSLLEHVCWYAYYVPLAAIPALFLVTALGMEPERKHRRVLQGLVLLPMALLALGVATNDLHFWMFHPIEGATRGGSWGGYRSGPLWYVFYGFVILCIVLGLVFLAMADRRRRSGRRTLVPSLLLLAMLGMMMLVDRLFGRRAIPFPWAFPETAVFCMLGIFESCLRSRLIPFNEHYIDFFAQLRLPAEITDPALRPVYRTAAPVPAEDAQRRSALKEPLLLDENTRLYGKKLPAGCAFWIGDESTLNRLNEALADANEVLASENELLSLETEQAEARLRVDARNRVYAKAAAEVYDTQKKIAALLERLRPEAEDYRAVLAKILLMNAYVKRKTNLVLQAAERDTVTAQELYLALDESARFLELCGVRCSVEKRTGKDFTAAEAAVLYDSFELLAERLAEGAGNLLALLNADSLRLMADCPTELSLPQTPAEQTATVEDGLLYLTLRAKKGGAV